MSSSPPNSGFVSKLGPPLPLPAPMDIPAADEEMMETEEEKKTKDPVKTFHMEMEGYTGMDGFVFFTHHGRDYNFFLLFSVEDHFAKALGATWLELQKNQKDKAKNNSSASSNAAAKNNLNSASANGQAKAGQGKPAGAGNQNAPPGKPQVVAR